MTWRPVHLSVSSVALYMACPARFKQRYVDKIMPPATPAQAFGIATHRALEAEHSGENSELALVKAWNAENEILAARGEALQPGKIHALQLLDRYRALGLGGRVGVPERRFSLPFPSPRIPVPLLGYVDLLIPECRRFREFKTTASTAWTDTKIALEPQMHAYGWAYGRIFGHRAEAAEYIILSTREPTVTVIEGVPSPDGFRAFELEAEATWAGIVAGDYPPCGQCELCKPKPVKPMNGPSVDWEG